MSFSMKESWMPETSWFPDPVRCSVTLYCYRLNNKLCKITENANLLCFILPTSLYILYAIAVVLNWWSLGTHIFTKASGETLCHSVHLQKLFFFTFPCCRSSLEAAYRSGDGSMTPRAGICSPYCPRCLPCLQSRLFTFVRTWPWVRPSTLHNLCREGNRIVPSATGPNSLWRSFFLLYGTILFLNDLKCHWKTKKMHLFLTNVQQRNFSYFSSPLQGADCLSFWLGSLRLDISYLVCTHAPLYALNLVEHFF